MQSNNWSEDKYYYEVNGENYVYIFPNSEFDEHSYLNIREGMSNKAFSNNKYIKYHRDNVFNG